MASPIAQSPAASGATTTTTTSKIRLCQECCVTAFRYVCPRCAFRSCSLACCQRHKVRRSCNGRRDRTAFLRTSQMTDATLQSDYHFLEDVVRQVDTGKRLLAEQPQSSHKRPRRSGASPFQHQNTTNSPHPLLQTQSPLTHNHSTWAHVSARWRNLAQQTRRDRDTLILFQPNGMQRRLQNQTRLLVGNNAANMGEYKQSSTFISMKDKKETGGVGNPVWYWTVEWVVYSSPPTINDTTTPGDTQNAASPPFRIFTTVIETTRVKEALGSALSQIERQTPQTQLTPYRLLIQQIPQHLYALVDGNETLRDVLQDRTVIEFPTLHVVPASRLSEFALAVTEVNEDKQVMEE